MLGTFSAIVEQVDLATDQSKAILRALINRLRARTTQLQFINQYKVETGDIFLWDNLQVLHSATPIEYSDESAKRRLLYRISTQAPGAPAQAPCPAFRPGRVSSRYDRSGSSARPAHAVGKCGRALPSARWISAIGTGRAGPGPSALPEYLPAPACRASGQFPAPAAPPPGLPHHH
ncbi:hypothetical protein A6768_12480 [Sphingobium yanoikuyae]|uniref:TauD/TfdA-like domain-containing protein n=1 Tax=Sphingobium yanoikuyae TaxID=13690 RepID=A0A291N044_SPHYA|nr:hypothetical protein A6768_12480 [Sphingobium yanoikuyae]